jgi:hypothetical protein
MAKLSADVEKALGIHRRLHKLEKPGKKLKDILAASEGVNDTAALFLLSKAALHRGAEIALFELSNDDAIHAAHSGLDAPRPNVLAPEAKDLLQLAGRLALLGVTRGSLLCAVFYVEVVWLVGQPDAALRLANVVLRLMHQVEWKDMFADITAGSEPDTFLEKGLKVMHRFSSCQCC